MAISTLDTERLVSHCGAAVGQSLRLVTRGASEFLVISIELKPRVLLMVKHELVKVVTVDMALRSSHSWSVRIDRRVDPCDTTDSLGRPPG